MIYFLLKPDGTNVPVLVTDQDEKSIKVTNIDGFSRWIRYSDFIITGLNVITLK